jgi:hypothetical protein
MDPLAAMLMLVDEKNGRPQLRRLAEGRTGRGAQRGRRLRALGARLLVALAARLDATALPARRTWRPAPRRRAPEPADFHSQTPSTARPR